MVALGAARRHVLVGSLLLALVTMAQSNAFRGSSTAVKTGLMRVEDLRAAMLDELMAALGHGNRVTEERLRGAEEALRPTFRALPKNEHGNLDHAAVRYALHRLFVLRHGMYIKGLEPGGEGWTGVSPTEVLDERVPAYVQELFEKRLDRRGMGLHEVSILAATLEHLIHDEAVTRLRAAYRAHALPLEGHISSKQVEEIVDTYMVMFLLGTNSSKIDAATIKEHRASITKVYPSWPESQKFTREVQHSVSKANVADKAFASGRLTFNATSRIIEEIMERYGRWQDSECRDLKTALMELEDKGSGRVLLKDFYGSAKTGAWQFTESKAYLQELGALDESNPQRQAVIIPNYINSLSNCLASSSLYSVCCLNECEPLLGHLERELGVPDAEPDRVLELVAAMPSATVQAPRAISAELRSLLDEVARHHNGRVPLHGRLLGQWMHHAFPRECPYPHRSGTTNPMTADQWISERGSMAHHASDDEMQRHIDEAESATCTGGAEACAAAGAIEAPLQPLLWTPEEELVVSTTAAPAPSRRPRWRTSPLRSGVALAALASLGAMLLASGRQALAILRPQAGHVLPFAGKAHFC